MARGADQLEAGSPAMLEPDWLVPHFEKMLYDNALLCRVYAHLWRGTGRSGPGGSPWRPRTSWSANWAPPRAFASALDADSDDGPAATPRAPTTYGPGAAGRGAGRGRRQLAAEYFHVTEEGTFEGGASVLQLPDRESPCRTPPAESVRRRLFEARAARPRPERDDKVVTAWNGLAIAALAETGTYFERTDLVEAAVGAARLLTEVHTLDEGRRLVRTSRNGVPAPARAYWRTTPTRPRAS